MEVPVLVAVVSKLILTLLSLATFTDGRLRSRTPYTNASVLNDVSQMGLAVVLIAAFLRGRPQATITILERCTFFSQATLKVALAVSGIIAALLPSTC